MIDVLMVFVTEFQEFAMTRTLVQMTLVIVIRDVFTPTIPSLAMTPILVLSTILATEEFALVFQRSVTMITFAQLRVVILFVAVSTRIIPSSAMTKTFVLSTTLAAMDAVLVLLKSAMTTILVQRTLVILLVENVDLPIILSLVMTTILVRSTILAALELAEEFLRSAMTTTLVQMTLAILLVENVDS